MLSGPGGEQNVDASVENHPEFGKHRQRQNSECIQIYAFAHHDGHS